MTGAQLITGAGLSSGEGLIHAVRDPVTKVNKEGQEETVDPGVADKRLLIKESEFSRVLRVMGRPENIPIVPALASLTAGYPI
jgi:hypothetical protein